MTRQGDDDAGGRAALIEALTTLFRRGGFDGISMSDISRETGLGKSSLYHYFPRGKTEMVAAVIAHVRRELETRVHAALTLPPDREGRVDAFVDVMRAFYANGDEPCLVPSLLTGDAETRRPHLKALLTGLADAVVKFLTEYGVGETEARRAARDVLMRIQGGVIVAHALENRTVFQDMLIYVRNVLLAQSANIS